jgi:hypothetical protein
VLSLGFNGVDGPKSLPEVIVWYCRSENIREFGKLYRLKAGNFDGFLSKICERFITKRHAVKGGVCLFGIACVLVRFERFFVIGVWRAKEAESTHHEPPESDHRNLSDAICVTRTS